MVFDICTVSIRRSPLVLPVAEARQTPPGDQATAQAGEVWPGEVRR